jgi:hypothetical protein
MSPPLRAALALVRGWTCLYTAAMAPALRDARRAEIESDLWEFHEDARRRGYPPSAIGAHMLLRLVLGMPADLFWRAEDAHVPSRIVQDALWATAVASVVFVWWLASTLQALEPPEGMRRGGIDVMRIVYPFQRITNVPQPPPTPYEFARLTTCGHVMVRPPPPPPPPQPASR